MLEKAMKLALCLMVILLRGFVLNIKRNSSMSEVGGHQRVPNAVFTTSKRSASLSSWLNDVWGLVCVCVVWGGGACTFFKV